MLCAAALADSTITFTPPELGVEGSCDGADGSSPILTSLNECLIYKNGALVGPVECDNGLVVLASDSGDTFAMRVCGQCGGDISVTGDCSAGQQGEAAEITVGTPEAGMSTIVVTGGGGPCDAFGGDTDGDGVCDDDDLCPLDPGVPPDGCPEDPPPPPPVDPPTAVAIAGGPVFSLTWVNPADSVDCGGPTTVSGFVPGMESATVTLDSYARAQYMCTVTNAGGFADSPAFGCSSATACRIN